MSEEIIIRRYQSSDRDFIRKICGDTANRGNPVESFFKDREFIVDLVTSYYTDYEPTSLWVAQVQEKVVGYTTGCLHPQRHNRIMAWNIVPRAIIKAIFRGTLFHRETGRFLLAFFKSFQMGGFSRNIPVDKYPVHLHIDIMDGFRGKHIGQKLMDHFVEQVKDERLPGIHAVVREDNLKGCQFFERIGFSVLSRYSVFLPGEKNYFPGRVVVYGKQV